MEQVEAAIVGAGQAGLAVSHELTQAGVDHVVLERRRIGDAWRRRWESFCLVTPNWTVRLPGFPYDGDDPDGFMSRGEIVAYLERYARSSAAPVREGVTVAFVRAASGRFVLETSAGDISASTLVLATGAYQRVFRPLAARELPSWLPQMDVEHYRTPASLPPGKVLVVGSGQSGTQIAEELREAGREVALSCGRAPWIERRLAGHDLLWWLVGSGFMDQAAASLPSPAARLLSNPLATGHGGGHDLHLRTLQQQGVQLLGHFLGASEREARFAPDLAQSVAWGDTRRRELLELMRRWAGERHIEPPDLPEPPAFDGNAPERVDLTGFGSVLFTGGFRPDYVSWLPWPEAFDADGFPLQREGASVVVPGLFFVGVHFLRRRKSSLLLGVGEDAAVVARQVASSLARQAA